MSMFDQEAIEAAAKALEEYKIHPTGGRSILAKAALAAAEASLRERGMLPFEAIPTRDAVLEEAAKFIEAHQEAVNSSDNKRYLQPRKYGNLMNIAFAGAIRALKTQSPTEKPPLKLHFDNDYLMKKIDEDGDYECGVGGPPTTEENT